MAVSSVGSSSSGSTQQYGGNDDDTTSTNNNSTNDPPPSSTGNDADNTPSPQTDGNDAENPSSTQKDPPQGQSTLSQIPPADTAGTNTTSNTPSSSPDSEPGNAASTPTDTSGGQSGSSQAQSANTATTDKSTNTSTSNPSPQSSVPSSGNGTGNAPSTQTPPANTATNTATSSQPTASPAPSTGNGSNGASSTQTNASAGELTLTEKEPTNKVTTTITPANQSTSSPAQPANPSTNTATNTPTSAPSKLTNVEATQLLLPLDKDTSGPTDAQNARLLAAYQRDALRGADPAAIGFEQQTTLANQQLGSLSSDQREHYSDALAQGASRYNAAATSAERASIAESLRTTVFEPLNGAYQQAMADPIARVQQALRDPFGLSYLGTPGQLQNDQLAQMRRQFNQAATSQERARIFGQATDLRHTMQSQIASFINQQHSQLESQWQQADQEIDKALSDAAGMQIGGAGSGYKDTSAFQRLHLFIANGLNSERNVQEFQYRLGQTPDDFKQLHDWSTEATEKATWATSALHGDLFRRAPVLPPLPPDLTQTTADDSRMGNFGADMLYRYQQEDRRILDAEEMVGAASRPAHEKGQYLDAHTQPLPSPPLLPPIPLGVQSPMTSLSNTTADIAYQKSKSSSDGTTQGAASASSPPVRTVETIGGPTPPAPDPALAAAAAAANAAKPVTLSNTEATQLLSRLDKDPSIPDDAANANSLAGLQRDSMRSADSEAIGFEQQAIQANQEVEALPSQQRDFYRGALAAGTTYYNAAITQEQREKIAHAVRTDVIDPISRAYLQAMADPNARVQMAFSKPFGSVYLGAAGMQQVDLLAEMGQQFNRAATAEERARIFEQAADLRHVMQSQIASFVDQERSHVQEQWKQADKEINQALAEAKGMWVASAESGLDDTSSFERLNWFMNHGLNSERNAQEFQYRLSKSPDNFKLLHEWSADASKKAEWATSALQSDLFRRAPVLPPLPPDPTQTNIDNLRMGNFGGDLLYRYQLENRSIVDAMNMYHAASQHGPIQDSYLNAHTPPLPLWQQQLEDGFGRFFVGLIPVANLLVDYIVPAKSLPEWARQGIDFASGVVGMLMGEANFPKFGGAKGLNVSEFKPFEPVPVAGEASAATEAKPAPSFWQWLNDLTPKDPKLALANKVSDLDAAASPKPTEGSSIEPKPPKEEIKPGEGNAKNEPANAPKPEITTPVPGSTAALSGSTSGIPLVPEEYARPPSGKLTPDPNYRGLYRDEGGQNYIQQDGKTYPVTWNDDARSWQMMPREGSPNAPKMHINEKGNWEVNLDTGLTGGARSSKTAFYKHAFDLYESGKSFREIGKELGIEPPTAKRWIEAYLQQSGDMQPVRVGGQLERIYMGRGENIYQSFREGRSLPDVAQRYTDGDEFAAYRSGMRYANANDLLTDLIPQNRPWRNPPERAANQLRYPMSYQQSADIAQGYEEGKTDAQISQETHVREQWIKDMRGKRGNYSHKDQEWIQDVDDVDPAEATRQQPGARGEPGNTGEQPRLGMDDATQQPPPRPDKKLRLGQIADGRRAFNLYENGKTMSEIARELDINPATASAWVNRYLRESGDVWPRQAGGYSDKVYFPSGGAIYRELAEGRPLAEVANKFTGGDELQAIRSGTRFADREGLPSNVIPQDKPWRIRPEREYAEPGGIGPVQPELGGHSRPGQIEDLRAAFDRYERGDTFAEIGHEFNVHRDTARNWVEKYIRESGEVTPLEVRSHKAATHLWLGAPIYGELSRGTPLQEVADRFTDGNALASLHSAMRYAREQHLPTGMLLENRPWRIPQEGAPNTLSYAITPEQYDKILLANRQQKPTWLISEETGVPREWVARIKSEQGWAERGNLGELGEPQAKRRRTDVAPGDTGQAQPEDSGATQQPQTGTGGGTQQTETGTGSTTQQEPATSSQSEPSWGSKQLQQFSEDHTKLSKAEADSIDAWFNGHGPAPQSLQAELTARGYSDITPEMVRIFFTQRNPGLSARQIDRILRFIFM